MLLPCYKKKSTTGTDKLPTKRLHEESSSIGRDIAKPLQCELAEHTCCKIRFIYLFIYAARAEPSGYGRSYVKALNACSEDG